MAANDKVDILKPFLEMEDMEDSEKVFLFIQLVNEQSLIEAFKKQTLMMQMGMATSDLVYSFAYSVMRLAKPHLFDEEGNLCDL